MISPMRLILVSALAVFAVIALNGQAPEGRGGGRRGGPPKNLQVLPAGTNIGQTMRGFEAALGVKECTFCHVMGDFASDDNPKKVTARMMLKMVNQINGNFPDGKAHVSCYTCHRGAEAPLTEPPAAQ